MEIDLNTLSKDQLIHLVQVRGQALEFAATADQVLLDKLAAGDIEEGDFEKFGAAKGEILAELMKAEELIMAGQTASKPN